MNVTIIGTGYVGLVTGACLADVGNNVFCLDVDDAEDRAPERAAAIPIYEPGLEAIVKRNDAAGRLRFTTDVAASVAHGEVQFIAVGTPPDEDGSRRPAVRARRGAQHRPAHGRLQGDRRQVDRAGRHRRQGAARRSPRSSQKRGVDASPFAVVSNPEFLKEGAAVEDFMRPDRIVIGADDDARDRARCAQLYAPFQRNHERLLVMDVRSAELTKYAANAMLATRISFMNELANLAERARRRHRAGAPAASAPIRASATTSSIPGAGYGGSCFPKDVKALQRTARRARRGRCRCCAPSRTVNERAEARAGRQDRRALRRRPARAAASRSGASRSSPTPTTCARRRAAR